LSVAIAESLRLELIVFLWFAGIAAVAGTIAARVAMGSVCDWIGPRLGMSVVLLMTAPCVFGMALANEPIHFIMLRFGIGFGLAAFVACQFWTASMFNVNIVGASPPRRLNNVHIHV
jgi:MFS transporter, NNP family, nitrate/nitrite transporter